jgi:mannose-6-phosphate isomerase-like protein (cupin superfamily)
VRLGVFTEGEFPFHKHEEEDEFFFVLQGRLTIELENDSVHLEVHQGYTVPKGTIHRPKVSMPTAVLMMEGKGINPTGD